LKEISAAITKFQKIGDFRLRETLVLRLLRHDEAKTYILDSRLDNSPNNAYNH
jgi:hypothetical protein